MSHMTTGGGRATDGPGMGRVKCVVWDLDGTLWRGTMLSDGVVDLRTEIVEVIRLLDERGILHSVASRNDADEATRQLEAFGLLEYFLAPQIGWGSKSKAVARIAELLNLGIDSLAFVDDQEFELDEVAFEHPEVLCVRADDMPELVDALEFTPRFVTSESRHRRAMYRAGEIRDQAAQEFDGTNEQFLATLGLCMTIHRASESDLQRAEELTVRTNQLNSTGRTFSYEELDRLRTSPDHQLLIAGLEDRYGSYGKVGLALVETAEPDWNLKLLLMSCRVVSRGVGSVLLNEIMTRARAAGAGLCADFVETGRNRIMYITYMFSGFKELSRSGSDVQLRSDLSAIPSQPQYLELRIR